MDVQGMLAFYTDNMDKQDKHSIYSELEDVDKTCVHIVIAIDAVFAVLAYVIFPEGIFNTPFAQLTVGILLRLVGAVVFGILAILIGIDVITKFIRK